MRDWWLAAAAITLVERVGTFAYFIPTALKLMRDDVPPEAKSVMAVRWRRLNLVRGLLSLLGWLAALEALSLSGAPVLGYTVDTGPHFAREDEMAAARKIDVLTVKLDAKPGALAQVLGAFREAKVNVTASWGYQMGPGEAQAHFFTADVERARQALTKLGKTPKTEAAFWVEDADQIGNYHGVLEKIAKAGVNIEATDAFGIGGKFATVIFVADADVAKAAKALGV